MKLRIKGDSLRFRLTKTEVEQLVTVGRINVKVGFKEKAFYYQLAIGDILNLEARFQASTILVVLPEKQATSWATTDQVGISGDCDGIQVLIEKDFTCLKSRAGEDETDNFPNPLRR